MSPQQAVRGSGDVFADLGFSPADSSNLRLRSELMTALRTFVEREGLTQAEAAERLGVSQPRVSDLVCGKVSRFSLDSLVALATAAGMEVALKLRPAKRRAA